MLDVWRVRCRAVICSRKVLLSPRAVDLDEALMDFSKMEC